MSTLVIKNLRTTEQKTYTDQPDRGAAGFEEAFGNLRTKRDMLNQNDLPGPWVCFVQGEAEPTACPHCGSTGPFGS